MPKVTRCHLSCGNTLETSMWHAVQQGPKFLMSISDPGWFIPTAVTEDIYVLDDSVPYHFSNQLTCLGLRSCLKISWLDCWEDFLRSWNRFRILKILWCCFGEGGNARIRFFLAKITRKREKACFFVNSCEISPTHRERCKKQHMGWKRSQRCFELTTMIDRIWTLSKDPSIKTK